MDFGSAVIEEIRLEGLDGITLSALWLRLETRKPAFPIALDDRSKQFLWSSVIAPQKDLEFYELVEPRPPLIIYTHPEMGGPESDVIKKEPEEDRVELYPFKQVRDNDIVGSCATYSTRKKVSEDMRQNDKAQITLKQAIDKYGEKLVIVASQHQRMRAILISTAGDNFTMSDRIYCLLERVGRARYIGSVTNGKYCLKSWLGVNSKTLFYMRKKLCSSGLITSQVFTMRNNLGSNTTGKLLHLKNFFVETKPLPAIIMEKITAALTERPNRMEVKYILLEELNINANTFKKIYHNGPRYHEHVAIEMRLTKEMFPDAEESLHFHKTKLKERHVQVIRLLKPYVYAVTMDDEDEDEEDAEEDGDLDDTALPDEERSHVVLNYEEPVLRQLHHYVLEAGELGLNQRQLKVAFNLNRLDARALCKNLERVGAAYKLMHDVGRQREQRFVASDLLEQSRLHQDLLKEKKKILDHCKALQDNKDSPTVDNTATTTEEPTVVKGAVRAMVDDKPSTSVCPYDSFDKQMKDAVGLTESVLSMDEKGPKSSISRKGHVTMKMLKRANMVIDAVREAKVIDNLFYLQKRIIEEEHKCGVTGNIDKKSLYRIIKKLEKDGQIKVFRSTMFIREQERHVTLWCDPSLTANCNLVKSTIESAFHKMMALTKMEKREASQTSRLAPVTPPPSTLAHDSARTNHALLKSSCKVKDLIADNDAGRHYGFLPRMKRYQVIHEFIWYLVRGYGKPMNTPGGDTTLPETPELPADMEPVDLLYRVYADEYSWRRFIPPLPHHKDYPEGWFLVGDVLLLLPVSIFVQIIRFNYKCAALDEYLNHPIKKWVMVCHLPSDLRNSLMYERRYVFQFFSTIADMNHMGLFTIGKREFKEKEQIFVYIHINASIVDTTELSVPKHERSIKRFYFDNAFVVRDFWFSLQWICMNTFYEDADYMPSAEARRHKDHFREVEKSRTPEEVVDDGNIPGNQRGAGGLDTNFFSHLKRNWMYRYDTTKPKTKSSSATTKKTPTDHLEQLVQSSKMSKLAKDRQPPARDQDKTSKTQPSLPADTQAKPPSKQLAKSIKSTSIKTMTVEGIKPQKGGKGIKRKKLSEKFHERKRRRLFSTSQKEHPGRLKYDQRDIEAINRMTRERADWSSKEDSMLLLWKVTLTFLGGWRRDSIVSYARLRDQLHHHIPESRNKTSSACQRRLIHMLKRDETEYNVRMYVGEALQDKALVKEFLEGKTYKKNHADTFSNAEIAVKCFEKLRQKFINNSNRVSVQLPDTLDDVHEKYTLHKCQGPTRTVHHDIRNRWEIEFTVLHNLIHCAILLDDKTGRAHELYHLFNQYSEDLVNQVFAAMKSDRIVTKIKASVTRKSKLHTLPSVSMGTYHLSQRYTFFWVSKYPRTIFQHTYEVFQPLKELAQSVGGVTAGEHQWVLLEGIAGSAALIIGLLTCNKLVFETTLPVEIVTIDRSKPVAKKPRRVIEKTLSDEEEEARIEAVEKMRPKRPPKPDSEHVETASSILTTPTRPSQSHEASSVLLTNSSSGATHKPPATRAGLSLAHNQLLGAKQPSVVSDSSDNLVVNTCVVRVRLKRAQEDPPLQKWDFNFVAVQEVAEWNREHINIHPKTCVILLNRLRALQPRKLDKEAIFKQLLEDSHCTQEEVNLMNTIHNRVADGEVIGLTLYKLTTMFGDLPRFDWCLSMLLEKKVVVRVGVVVFRYVSHDHVRPWLINSYKNVKGRGVYNEQDESEDLMQSMSLKDFPGVPVLPEDYAIRPGKPQLSVSGGKIVELIAQDDKCVNVGKQPSSDSNQSTEHSTQVHDKQLSAASAKISDSANGKVISKKMSSKPVKVNAKKPPNESSKLKSVGLSKNILLKTVLPDDKIIQEQMITSDDIDLSKHMLKRKRTGTGHDETHSQIIPKVKRLRTRSGVMSAPSTTTPPILSGLQSTPSDHQSTASISSEHQSTASIPSDPQSVPTDHQSPSAVTSASPVSPAIVSEVSSPLVPSPASRKPVPATFESTTCAPKSPVLVQSVSTWSKASKLKEGRSKVTRQSQGSPKPAAITTKSLILTTSPSMTSTSASVLQNKNVTFGSMSVTSASSASTSSLSSLSTTVQAALPTVGLAASTEANEHQKSRFHHVVQSPRVITSPLGSALQMTSPRVITSPLGSAPRVTSPRVITSPSGSALQMTSPRVITSPLGSAPRVTSPRVITSQSGSAPRVTSPRVITSLSGSALQMTSPRVITSLSGSALQMTSPRVITSLSGSALQMTSPRVITSPSGSTPRVTSPRVIAFPSGPMTRGTSPRVITSPSDPVTRGAVVCNVGVAVQANPHKKVTVTPNTSTGACMSSTAVTSTLSTTTPSVKKVLSNPSASKPVTQAPVSRAVSKPVHAGTPKSSKQSVDSSSTPQRQKIRLKLPAHMSASDVDMKSIMKHVQKLMASGSLTPGKICVKIPDQSPKPKDTVTTGSQVVSGNKKDVGAVVAQCASLSGSSSSVISPAATAGTDEQSTSATETLKPLRQQSSVRKQSHPPQLDGCGDDPPTDDTLDLLQVDGTGDRPAKTKGKRTAHHAPKSSVKNSKTMSAVDSTEKASTEPPPVDTSMDVIVEEPGSSSPQPGEAPPDSPPQSGGVEGSEATQSLRAPSARIRKKKTMAPFRVPQAKSTYQHVLLVCRPWKTPEGTVNRSILQMMMEGLMLYIIFKPGISKAALVKKYSPILQPVPLMELFEMLQIIGCVEQDYLKQNRTPSLFSPRSTYAKMDRDQGKTDHLIIYRPTQACVIKLGRFVAQMQHAKRTS